jgi:hypothetical protein
MGPRILMSIMVSGFQIAVGNRDSGESGRASCLHERLHDFAEAAVRLLISGSVISTETLRCWPELTSSAAVIYTRHRQSPVTIAW